MNQFWKEKSLEKLNHVEWESLCDGCGKCCSHKFIDEDTDKLYFTSITCELFDPEKCQCSDYKNRISKVSACLKISTKSPEVFQWLPKTCAYSLINQGLDLPDWHHLVSGDKDLIHQEGHSVRGKVIFESDLDEGEEIEDFIISD
jgi:uncharacterized cysteine cluster protein YcgN (CxxCxxCC family)